MFKSNKGCSSSASCALCSFLEKTRLFCLMIEDNNVACSPGIKHEKGGLAQLARALAWHARGHRFEPDILHTSEDLKILAKDL